MLSAVQRVPESSDAAAPAPELLQRLQPESDVPALRVRRLPLRQAARRALHQAVAITYGRGLRRPPSAAGIRLGADPLGRGAGRRFVRPAAAAVPNYGLDAPPPPPPAPAAAAERASGLHVGGHREVAPFHMGQPGQRNHGRHQSSGFGVKQKKKATDRSQFFFGIKHATVS